MERPNTENGAESQLSADRNQEHVRLNAGLILKICQNQKTQPRERLLKEFERSGRTDSQALALKGLVLKMPDYDLQVKEDFEKAREYIELIFQTKMSQDEGKKEDVEESGMMEGWIKAGVFAYELAGEFSDRVVIHVPPTGRPPKLGQIKDSLRQVARFLENNPAIVEVVGSSLLLAHSLAKRLGFHSQTDGQNEFGLTFKMSREEFLKNWG